MRIVIPVVDESGLDAQISEHFGRTPFFAVVDLDREGEIAEQKTVPNAGEHFGGGGRRSDFILGLKPNVIIAYGMGPRGIGIFQSEQVAVLKANSHRVKDVIMAYKGGKLVELTEGCHEARHP